MDRKTTMCLWRTSASNDLSVLCSASSLIYLDVKEYLPSICLCPQNISLQLYSYNYKLARYMHSEKHRQRERERERVLHPSNQLILPSRLFALYLSLSLSLCLSPSSSVCVSLYVDSSHPDIYIQWGDLLAFETCPFFWHLSPCGAH